MKYKMPCLLSLAYSEFSVVQHIHISLTDCVFFFRKSPKADTIYIIHIQTFHTLKYMCTAISVYEMRKFCFIQ